MEQLLQDLSQLNISKYRYDLYITVYGFYDIYETTYHFDNQQDVQDLIDKYKSMTNILPISYKITPGKI